MNPFPLTGFWLAPLLAFVPPQAPKLGPTPAQPNWPVVGQLKTRHAKDIRSSTWSIGGETLDRDFANFQAYKGYLGPLGAKKIRLQGGWAKCEKSKAEGRPDQYDFKWMDDIVNESFAQGVSPWIELAYGNPIYEGGGEARLGGSLPTSPEALEAWDNWVRSMVNRYKDKVSEWEVWNEPDHGKGITPQSYALFYIRTANVIRSVQPNARLLGVALSNLRGLKWVDEFCQTLRRENALPLLDIFVYHGYAGAYSGWAYNPDDVYPQVEKIRRIVWQYKPGVVFFQGESGAPSTPNPAAGVFKDYAWTELSQAKWDLRRMLGDHGRGIETNLFGMSDMHYVNQESGRAVESINTKGILKTNPDKSIDRPKLAYKMAQHVFSLFDSGIQSSPHLRLQTNQINQSMYGYRHLKSGSSLITIWQNEHPPYDDYESITTTISMDNVQITSPVLVDLITGNVFRIPQKSISRQGRRLILKAIPVPDYPVLVADRSALLLQ